MTTTVRRPGPAPAPRKAPIRRRRPNNLAIGVVATIVLLLLGYAIFTKNIPFLHGHRVKIEFASSNQLITGSPVRIAGVNVGKVSSIDAGRGTTQIVTVELSDEGLPLHTDAKARIRPRLFLEGGFMVELNPGSPSAPELEENGTIPLAQTAIPVQFHQILSALNRQTRLNLRSVFDELATALEQGGAEALGRLSRPLSPLLRDLAWVAEAARGVRPHDASNTIRSSARITSALAEREAELGDLLTNLRVTTDAMAAEDVNLAATVRELDGLLAVAPASLTALDRSLPPVRRFAAAIRPGLRAAPAALDELSPLLAQLYGLTGPRELPRLLTRLAPTLATLPELQRRLTVLFPLVKPVMDCVRDRAVPVLEAKIDDGHLSTNRPVWQDLLHTMVGLNSASQNFDANGFAIRYLVGAGEQNVSTGQVPLIGTLQGTTSQPVLGSRPRWLGVNVSPPFRPDAPCTSQAAPDLKARTGPAMRSRRTGRRTIKRMPVAKLKQLLAEPPLPKPAPGVIGPS